MGGTRGDEHGRGENGKEGGEVHLEVVVGWTWAKTSPNPRALYGASARGSSGPPRKESCARGVSSLSSVPHSRAAPLVTTPRPAACFRKTKRNSASAECARRTSVRRVEREERLARFAWRFGHTLAHSDVDLVDLAPRGTGARCRARGACARYVTRSLARESSSSPTPE
jgi:hypothetical protein